MTPTQLHFAVYHPQSATEKFVGRNVSASPIKNNTCSQASVNKNTFTCQEKSLIRGAVCYCLLKPLYSLVMWKEW